jgi:hypothetical protein
MDQQVKEAMAKWPNVPALFGWLGLDRRGRWLLQGEVITRPQLIEFMARNYEADSHGRWFFQNGPQRAYVALEYAPLVLRAEGEGLTTHAGLPVERPTAAYLDEEGRLVLVCEHGPGLLAEADLSWALERLQVDSEPVSEEALARALALPPGEATELGLRLKQGRLPVTRLNAAAAPAALGFERTPAPRDDDPAAANKL